MSIEALIDMQIARIQERMGKSTPEGQDQLADTPASLPEPAQPTAHDPPIPEAAEPAGEQLAASDEDDNPFSPKARLGAARAALDKTRTV